MLPHGPAVEQDEHRIHLHLRGADLRDPAVPDLEPAAVVIRAALKWANTAGCPEEAAAALICVTPLSQTLNQPLFLSRPPCSQRAPPLNRAKTVSACTWEALICVTPVSQILNQPLLSLAPVCS